MGTEEDPNPSQEDSDDNIYDNFVQFNFEDIQDKHEDRNKTSKEVEKLLEKVKDLTTENEELKKLNEILKKNLSSLLKTAKNEVERKDSTIKELRAELDSVACRKRSKITKDKYTETECLNNVCKCSRRIERCSSNERRKRFGDSEERKKEESFLVCDSKRRSIYFKDKTLRSSDKYRGYEDYKYKDKHYSDSKRSFRHSYRDHLKYDSLDKKKHSEGRRDSPNSLKGRESSRRKESLEIHKSEKSQSKEWQQSKSKDSSLDKVNTKNISGEKPSSKSEENHKTQENKVQEERLKKEEKTNLNGFETKSPLDALYNFPDTSRGWNPKVSQVEEGEFGEDDWTLSFKNERRNSVKPLTLYSRRMMKKLSEEEKKGDEGRVHENKNQEKVEKSDEFIRCSEVEKEPGELTDDENIIEGSKEFQELTKVASIESKLLDKSNDEVFKEPLAKEKSDSNKNCSQSIEGEQEKVGGQLVEFSPFKNNYKLIEISPVKPQSKDHVLDFYKVKPPVTDNAKPTIEPNEKPSVSSYKGKINNLLKPENAFQGKVNSTNKTFKKSKAKEKKRSPLVKIEDESLESKANVNEIEEKQYFDDKKTLSTELVANNSGRGKRASGVKRDVEIPEPVEKNYKRKRENNEFQEKCEEKKHKTIKAENCGRITRSKKEKTNGPDQEKDKVKEDISFFEFFKPITSKTKSLEEGRVQESQVSTSLTLTSVLCLQTPNKKVQNLKNLTINEQMICQVNVEGKNGFLSPAMTPRRMLKSDLMLTDSEDDSLVKKDHDKGDEPTRMEGEQETGEEDEYSDLENSQCDSDSGASDFVDLL